MKKFQGPCNIPSLKRLFSLMSQYEPLIDLLKGETCQWSELVELFALKYKQFTTLLATNVSTMVSAWSRQCGIQLENAHAV